MKKGIHPENYRPVVFKDMSNGDCFLSRSTCATKETIEFEGQTYPVIKIEISVILGYILEFYNILNFIHLSFPHK